MNLTNMGPLNAEIIYTRLKTILHNVGLENNSLLSAVIKYYSLFHAVAELTGVNANFIYPYISKHLKEIYPYVSGHLKDSFIKTFHYFLNGANYFSYKGKILSLCNKKFDNTTQEYQKKIVNKICTEYTTNKYIQENNNHSQTNHTQESLFSTAHDNFTALCIILGDQELCSEVLS